MEDTVEKTNESTATVSVDRESNFTRGALYSIVGVFLILPFIFVPSLAFPLELTKTVLILLGTLIGLVLFIISRLREGSLSILLSIVILGAWLLPLSYFFSALFSSSSPLVSFMGQPLGVDTVLFITVNVLLLTILPFIVRTKQRILGIYTGLLLSFIIVALFQGVRLAFGPDVLSFGILTSGVDNALGKWNDLGIYFGLTAIVSLITLEGLKLHPLSKIILYIVLLISLFFLGVINFAPIWFVLGLFALGFLIYKLLKKKFVFMPSKSEFGMEKVRKVRSPGLAIASLLVLIISITFIVAGSSIATRTNAFFGISQIEARPSLQSTIGITREVYSSNLILGSGPNTFNQVWAELKPPAVNNTLFWNIDFSSGIGFVPTSFITTGVVGMLSWIIFFALFLYSGVRALVLRPVADVLAYYLSLSTFVTALYLWIFSIVYVPNSVMLSFAFLFTGLYLATLRYQEGGPKEVRLVFSESPRLGFVTILGLTVVLILSGAGAYFVSKRYIAAVYFQQATEIFAVEGDQEEVKRLLRRSQGLVRLDRYARFASNLELRALTTILSNPDVSVEERRERFETVLARAIENAQEARDINPSNYQNWFSLGRVYQSVVQLEIEGAYENARDAYTQALALAPHNPTIHLALAELEVLRGNTTEARARIQDALREKNNYTAAVFLLAQIQVNENQIPEAIQSVEAATLLEPNNSVVFFQLGFLKYNQEDYEGAFRALQRAVELNDVYANARYFLGLTHYRLGRTQEAIAEFRRVEKTNPDNAEISLILSNLEEGQDPLTGLGDIQLDQNLGTPPIGGE